MRSLDTILPPMYTHLSGRMGCWMGPASSENWLVRRMLTSSILLTGRLFMSALNS